MSTSKTWIEIDRQNLIHNFGELSKLSQDSSKLCVVKANAYGHGLKEVVEVLEEVNPDFYGVDSLDEAMAIRDLGVKRPDLVLGFIPDEAIEIAIRNDISFVVYDLDLLKHIVSLDLSIKAKVHLKIETGLNRQGLDGKDLLELVKYALSNHKHIEIEGASTHFANVEDTLDMSYPDLQVDNFKRELLSLKEIGCTPKYIHSSASAATMIVDDKNSNMVRFGLSLYGHWPSRETEISAKNAGIELDLRPVLSLKSKIAQVKYIEKGETVGYGRSWKAKRKSTIAVIPVGYYDGIDRKLSSVGSALVKDAEVPLIGRVAMNMIMVDVTDVTGVTRGDEVVLMGQSGDVYISVEDIAKKIDTINYEVLARINPLIERKVV